MTYNKYLTDGIQNGTIKEVTDENGIRSYKVRKNAQGEVVVGYEPSDCMSKETPTEAAEREGKDTI